MCTHMLTEFDEQSLKRDIVLERNKKRIKNDLIKYYRSNARFTTLCLKRIIQFDLIDKNYAPSLRWMVFTTIVEYSLRNYVLKILCVYLGYFLSFDWFCHVQFKAIL